MALPSTKCLDHVIHLSPLGKLAETAEEFRKIGFNVLPGGQHTGGLTENMLVVLGDGIYVELIAFVKPVDAYPPGSPERSARENHPWAAKQPGFIDYAFLGTGSETVPISDIINGRAKAGGHDALYDHEVPGGRTRPDGQVIKWLITPPRQLADGTKRRLPLPFFCGDVTPRDLRVPTDPPSNVNHPCTAIGIASIRFQAPPERFDQLSHDLTYIAGNPGVTSSEAEREWKLDAVKAIPGHSCQLHLSTSDKNALGISEVAFYVQQGPPRIIQTSYAQLRFVTD